jgi:CheY-like chemotaxis protein
MAEHRILVVDDNHEVRHMVSSWLRTLGSGIEIIDVPSAEEAMLITSSLRLDLVVLDHRLPGMTGVEMVTRLQKRRPGIKIILFTGVEDAATRKMVAEAGVEAYFYKPIEIPAFLEAVRRCLGVSPLNTATASPTTKSGSGKATARQSVKGAKDVNGKEAAGKEEGAEASAGNQALINCLAALKQQALAISAILTDENGLIIEQVGTAPGITAGSTIPPVLLEISKASRNVAASIGKITYENLSYFTTPRQRIYLAPFGSSYVLLLVTPDYTELEKLGLIDRVIQMALQEIMYILQQQSAEEPVPKEETPPQPIELPTDVTVDQATLAGVEGMFSQVKEGNTSQQADGYWDDVDEKGGLDTKPGGDVLSYDQAKDMGLTPEDKRET